MVVGTCLFPSKCNASRNTQSLLVLLRRSRPLSTQPALRTRARPVKSPCLIQPLLRSHRPCWIPQRLLSTYTTSIESPLDTNNEREPLEKLDFPIDLHGLFTKELAQQESTDKTTEQPLKVTRKKPPLPDIPALYNHINNNDLASALSLVLNPNPNAPVYPREDQRKVYERISKLSVDEILALFEPYSQYLSTKDKEGTGARRRIQRGLKEATSFWKIDKIKEILHKSTEERIQAYLFNILMQAYRESLELDLLLNIPSNLTSESNTRFCNTAMDTALKQKQLQHVDAIFEKMKSLNCIPDTASFNIWIRAKLVTLDIEGATEIYENMILRKIQPTIATYNTFLSYVCQNKKWSILDKWVDRLEENSMPNSITLRIILAAVTEHEEPRVVSAFDRIAARIPPSKDPEYVLNSSIAVLLRLKKINTALGLLRTMFESERDLSVYAYNLLIHALTLKGDMSSARKLLYSMENNNYDRSIPEPDLVSFTTLIHGYIRGAPSPELIDMQSILDIYRHMLDRKIYPNQVLRSVLLYGLLKSGSVNVSAAQSMFDLMLVNDKAVKTSAAESSHTILYNIMIDGYFIHHINNKSKIGRSIPHEPYRLLEMATKTKVPLSTSTLNIMVRGLGVFNSEWIEAEKMVEWFESKGVMMDERTTWYFVYMAYRRGHLNKARKWLEKYESRGCVVHGDGLVHIKTLLIK
ncbi:hypothetical protein J3Q64DRAFT_1713339 [Phycomyces blakesleeanus]|uniref:Pentacotripeptide-repeat region of PRORP domain-containing protein n=2 Tax=Phycomyces blakesleeanus TaxID=4837 RepID=A0A162V0F9_PHYB8|nr:hypothetical protein PHYBLDRAFT_179001 [Phycomyces blakesleeanus NRRL 1555(-)]OAD79173.1 hypothetical protein PHYBLDRAFT_179001 [Phycomyces blakesleeanus NRRL 1555(-)]|eukprot:XP_018297213.1 hypothetical protein PHYBLDRAFT_179001 [Phycomyces blakesleeanus NRRL 1555(-)]